MNGKRHNPYTVEVTYRRGYLHCAHTFAPDCDQPHPGKGRYYKWGSLGANLWLTAGTGRSWREAAANAAKRLAALYRGADSLAVTVVAR